MLEIIKQDFLNKDYESGLRRCALLYKTINNNNNIRKTNEMTSEGMKEALNMWVLLLDLAKERRDHAEHLYEYYFILKASSVNKEKSAERLIIEIIMMMDQHHNYFAKVVNSMEESKMHNVDGILFNDLKFMAGSTGFAEILKRVLHTKIVFTSKDELYEFLNLLIDNDLEDLTMKYLESMYAETMDVNLQNILKKVFTKKTLHNNNLKGSTKRKAKIQSQAKRKSSCRLN